ncbi:IS3 family transposase [Massilia glaciei]|uniref:IS3 family transposase n=1 Tax=Massilia glaciei TaxID=1524097 RepID=UPI00351DA695
MKDNHEASDRTYGSPRVVHDVLDAGLACSENRVARLMKAAGCWRRRQIDPERRNLLPHPFSSKPKPRVASFRFRWVS